MTNASTDGCRPPTSDYELGSDGHYYKYKDYVLHNNRRQYGSHWQTADADCKSDGAQLATFKDRSEYEAVTNFASQANAFTMWIGGYNRVKRISYLATLIDLEVT